MVVVAQHGDALPLLDPLLIDSYGFTLLTLPSLVAATTTPPQSCLRSPAKRWSSVGSWRARATLHTLLSCPVPARGSCRRFSMNSWQTAKHSSQQWRLCRLNACVCPMLSVAGRLASLAGTAIASATPILLIPPLIGTRSPSSGNTSGSIVTFSLGTPTTAASRWVAAS